MDFDDSLSAQLPSRRDDEPPGLRQDILDELADHLACAYKRELLRGAQSDEARRRVLEQFGDPAAVARRLWFDAMKGKIMTQRLLIGTCLLLIVISGAALALMRQQSVLAQRQIAEANAQLAHALAQSQATNQEMLKQLQKMADAVQPGQSPDWIPVSFKLTQQTAEGPPAVGYGVSLGRAAEISPGGRAGTGLEYPPLTEVVHRVSDGNGLVDFGVVRPGDWQFDLVGKWKGPNTWHCRGTLNVLPGIKVVKSIVCPKAPPDTAPVTLRVTWPDDLAAKNYMVEASFTHSGVTYQAPLQWTLGPNPNYALSSGRSLLCGPRDGKIKQADLRFRQTLYYWQFADAAQGGMVDFGSEKINRTHLFADLQTKYARLEASAAKLDVGDYNLTGLATLRARPAHHLKVQGERFDVLAYTAPGQWGWYSGVSPIHTLQTPPDEAEPVYSSDNNRLVQEWSGGRTRNEPSKDRFVTVSDSFWQGTGAHFVVQPGAPSTWTIRLPDEIVKFLREEVKTGESGKAKAEPQ